MATHRDGHGYGTPDGVYKVEVEELGPDERSEHGTVVVEVTSATGWSSDAQVYDE